MVVRNVVRSPVRAVVQSVFGEGESFHPFQLFRSGAQGAWYDPSDYSTLFQNSTGTTPVTAVEQPVRLMLDRSRGLVLGSELVTNGDFSDGTTTGWMANTATLSVSSGALLITNTGTNGSAYQDLTTVAGRFYKLQFTCVAENTAQAQVFVRDGSFSGTIIVSNLTLIPGTTYDLIFVAASTTTTVRFLASGVTTDSIAVDNISVRELPGNHATAPNDASRPVLRARYNLLTFSEQFDNAAWSLLVANTGATPTRTANAGTDPLGGTTADRLQFSRTLSGAVERSAIMNGTATFVSGTQYTASFYAKSFSGADQEINLTLNANGAVTQTFTATSSWQRFTYTFTSGATFTATANAFRIGLIDAASSALTSDVLLWGASLLTAADHAATGGAYQRIGAATDYDTGPPWRPYLAFDGSDDSMSTSSIDFSGTDEMTLFAGVTKLSDAALGIVAELSASLGAGNPGSFFLTAPRTAATGDFAFNCGGTAFGTGAVSANSFAAPTTRVMTGIGDISGDTATLRIDGVQAATSATDQGTGNFGNYPLFIGRRNNTSLPFNGRLYSLAVLGRTATAPELTAMETWIAGKTGVSL